MTRKHSESSSTRNTEKATEEEEAEEGSSKQREVLLCPATRGGSVTARPNRKHKKMASRMESTGEDHPFKRVANNQLQTKTNVPHLKKVVFLTTLFLSFVGTTPGSQAPLQCCNCEQEEASL